MLSNNASRTTINAISHQHHEQIINHNPYYIYIYIAYYTSHIRIEIISLLAELTQCTETKYFSSFRDVLPNLHSCNGLLSIIYCCDNIKLRNYNDKLTIHYCIYGCFCLPIDKHMYPAHTTFIHNCYQIYVIFYFNIIFLSYRPSSGYITVRLGNFQLLY
jgi:hypothetical protein